MVTTKVTLVETVDSSTKLHHREVCQPVEKMASLSPSKGEEGEEDEENVSHIFEDP